MLFPPFDYKNRQTHKTNAQILTSNNIEELQQEILGYTIYDDAIAENEDEAEVIRRAFDDLVDKRLFLYQISSNLQKYCEKEGIEDSSNEKPIKFYPMKVLQILRTPQYSGRYYVSDTELRPSIFPKIVDEETWNQAQSILDYREFEGRGSTKQYDHPLSGFLRCSTCTKHYYWKQRVFKDGEEELRAPYKANYQHITTTKFTCGTDTYVSSVNIEPLVRMLILKLFTTRELLEDLKECYINYYHLTHSTRIGNASIPTYPASAERILSQLLQRLIRSRTNLSVAQKNIDMEEKRIQDILDITKQVQTSFSSYIENTLREWFSGDPIKRFDIIRTVFETILIDKGSITFYLGTEVPITIKYKPINDYWNVQKNKYGNSKLNHTNYKDKTKEEEEDEVISFLYTISKHLFDDRISKSLFKINTANQNLLSMDTGITCKIYTAKSDYICISDSSIKIEDSLIYQINGMGRYFLNLTIEGVPVDVLKMGDTVLLLTLNNVSYFNSRYIHGLPEWYYGKNYEYFKVGRKRYIFEVENNKIYAKYFKNRGEPEILAFQDVIKEICNSEHHIYVDIE